jgi:N-methylhydantoinase B
MTRTLETGDVVTIRTPGAGGWGDPYTRNPASVLRDVTEELVSPQRAAECYGVVVAREADSYVVDEAATAERRARGVR